MSLSHPREHIGEGLDYPDTLVNLYRYTL